MSCPNSLIARLYKVKYYPRCDFMHAMKGSNSSFVWESIHEACVVRKEGFRWMIGDGHLLMSLVRSGQSLLSLLLN